MNQQEALTSLASDILKMQKKKSRKLAVALMVSLLFNVALSFAVFDMKANLSPCIDDAVVIGAMTAKKPSEHITTRQKLRDIAEVKTFDELLNRCVLTEEERQLMREHYLNGKSFVSISMDIGYSEDWVKHRHQKILKKIQKLL